MLFSTAGVDTAGSAGGDYVNVVNQLTSTSTPFGYQLIDDDDIEGTETFQLTLMANTAGGSVTVSPPGAVATITIIEDDSKQCQFA